MNLKASVWAPSLQADSLLSQAALRICVGHYASADFKPPPKSSARLLNSPAEALLELSDSQKSRWLLSSGTAHLGAVLARYFPPPARLTQRWAKRFKGQRELFAWEAVPPEGFVALGMVCSNSDDPPPTESIRCLPAAWVRPAAAPPRRLWDDSGSSGARGAIWLVNSLGLVAVTPGHEPPAGPFYEPASELFDLSDAIDADDGAPTRVR